MLGIKNYVPISEELSGFIGELLRKYLPTKMQYALDTGTIALFAQDDGPGGGGCVNCQGGCTGTCSGVCQGCSGTCTANCNTCKGGCTGSCSGTCSAECTGNCSGTCSGTCENYCQICQTFCEKEQIFSDNTYVNKGTGMGNSFAWNYNYESGDKIIIEAEKWNELAGYINDAQIYCSLGNDVDVKDDVETGDLITAAIWNNLNDGLANLKNGGRVSSVTKGVDKIKATEVNLLADKYNEAKINSGLPSNPNGASQNLCCQKGMNAKDTWGSQQPCTQTPRCNTNQSS